MNAPAAVLLLGLVGASCTDPGLPQVRVFASASLTASFEQLAAAFEAAHPDVRVQLHCAGTPRLVLQLREGAVADVFASADMIQMQRVVEAGHTSSPVKTFAHNELAIITARQNPHRITALADLERADLAVLYCGPNVPAGRYARAALARANVHVQSLSDEPSVRAVVSKVHLGVVDAGIVYATDAQRASRRAPNQLHSVKIPAQHNITAAYAIATLSAGEQQTLGQRFVAFTLGPVGQRILATHGFATP